MKPFVLALAGLAVAAVALWSLPELAARQVAETGLSDPAWIPEPREALGPGERVVFLELGSEGCESCEAMKPVVQAVKDRYDDQVTVIFYDVRKNPGVAGRYRVTLIPTQVFLAPDGTEFYRHQGYLPLPMVKAVLHRMGVRPP